MPILVAIALGSVFLDAWDLGALVFGMKDVARECNLTPAATGMVASAIIFSGIIGALPALVISAIRRRYMSESPAWAANQGDLHGADSILRSAWSINAQVASDANLSAQSRPRRASWRNSGALLLVRWEPSGYDVDAEDFADSVR